MEPVRAVPRLAREALEAGASARAGWLPFHVAVAGVVVTRPDDLPAARRTLDETGLETASVATGAPIAAAEATEHAKDRFVVLPPAALHDPTPQTAEQEHRAERVRDWDEQAKLEAVAEVRSERSRAN